GPIQFKTVTAEKITIMWDPPADDVTPGPPSVPEPGSPTKLKVVDTTKTSVTLGWVKPAYDGGSPITSYVVEKREGEEQEWTVVSTKGEVRTTEYVVSHLQPSVNYYFRVSAINCAGQGEPIEMMEPVQAKDILGTTSIIAKAGEDVQTMIPFKGRPPPTVTWRKGDKNLGIDERYIIQNTESSTLLTIPQVTRNDTGKYVLTIENGVGEAKSTFVNVKVLDTPSACQKLQLKHVSRGTVTLVWEPPLINGGSEITNYAVEKRDATKRAWSTVTTKCSHTTFKLTNLSEKTAFFFRVLAENEIGLGEPCETSEPVKAADIPGPVKDLAMKDSTKTSVKLQWSKPKPSMSWLKDNLPLKETEHLRFKKTENKISLSIKNTKKEHGGKYTLILDNVVCRKTFTITVITLGPPSKPKAPLRLDEIKADINSEYFCLYSKVGGSKLKTQIWQT
uniref:Fibronectin type-III domain-containing protein n=1 Tax=Amazona collaria TaxID=241587 RepID=A0A8B9IW33_9PSIT